MSRHTHILLAMGALVLGAADCGKGASPVTLIVSPDNPVVNTCQGASIEFIMRGTDADGDLRLSGVWLDGVHQGVLYYDNGYDDMVTWSHTFNDLGTHIVRFNNLDFAGNYGSSDGWTVEVEICSDRTGRLEVGIGPQEAVGAGAKWKVVGYTDWLDSGQAAYNLPPGYHNVEFNSVEGWFEPKILLMRAIGDVPVSEVVEYIPVPVFTIGEIPRREAPHGERLKFYVDANWLADPVFTMQADPEPVGPMWLDPASGLFTYEPNEAEDRAPFDVTFTATSGADANEQTVMISPKADLPTEYAMVSQTTQDYPDPCDRDYILINEFGLQDPCDPNSWVLFNCEMRATRSVTIAGKGIICEDVENNLVFAYDNNYDINDLTIYAETLVIRDPLRLPQTDVTIYARELVFEGDGNVNTTPLSDWRALTLDPNRCSWENGYNDELEPVDGNNGHAGGDISLFIESFEAEPQGLTRFIMKGGKGQAPEPGENGKAGANYCTGPKNWKGSFPPDLSPDDWFNKVVLARFIVWDDSDPLDKRYREKIEPGGEGLCATLFLSCTGILNESEPCDGQYRHPRAVAPVVNGYDAVPAGTPGTGGSGGDLSCTLNIFMQADVDNAGGDSNEPADTNGLGYYKGGLHGEPSIAYKVFYRYDEWLPSEVIYTRPEPTEEASAPSAEKPYGDAGRRFISARPLAWLSPYALKMVLAHAKDAYLYGYVAEAAEILQEYYELLNTYMDQPEWDELPEKWRFDFEQMHQEIICLLHRLEYSLDYFGNPPDWVPRLSFEVFQKLYKDETEHAIRVLYLSYWLQEDANSIIEKQEGLSTCRQKLWEQTEQFRGDYATVTDLLPQISNEAWRITA
ncbi:MAG: hypothetical protein JSU94_08235, partial [Phycisphaerales bacterium]